MECQRRDGPESDHDHSQIRSPGRRSDREEDQVGVLARREGAEQGVDGAPAVGLELEEEEEESFDQPSSEVAGDHDQGRGPRGRLDAHTPCVPPEGRVHEIETVIEEIMQDKISIDYEGSSLEPPSDS